MIHGRDLAPGAVEPVLLLPLAAAVAYLAGVGIQQHRGDSWPWWRSVLWIAGLTLVAVGFAGAGAGHAFVTHMWAHVLIGMVAPLCLVLAAPVTLALRCLHVSRARRVSRLLSSAPVRIVTAPAVAALLSVGGLWVLYRTPLHQVAADVPLVGFLVSVHFLVAGSLFTAAVIPTDPMPHRAAPVHRMIVLVLALAAHGILAKSLYAAPPGGVPVAEAEAGAMLMFSSGDLVDAILLLVLCARWYRAAGRRLTGAGTRRAAPVPAPPTHHARSAPATISVWHHASGSN